MRTKRVQRRSSATHPQGKEPRNRRSTHLMVASLSTANVTAPRPPPPPSTSATAVLASGGGGGAEPAGDAAAGATCCCCCCCCCCCTGAPNKPPVALKLPPAPEKLNAAGAAALEAVVPSPLVEPKGPAGGGWPQRDGQQERIATVRGRGGTVLFDGSSKPSAHLVHPTRRVRTARARRHEHKAQEGLGVRIQIRLDNSSWTSGAKSSPDKSLHLVVVVS